MTNPAEPDGPGEVHLHAAAARGRTDPIRRLLASGADIDQLDGAGDTALIHAVRASNHAAARLLLANGASLQHPGDPAASHATAKNAISECTDRDILKLLAEFGADINHVDDCGDWPLKIFAEQNDLAAVQWLLQNGASVDQTSTGETAIFIAIASDNLAMVTLLLQGGANVHQQDCDMCVPLHRCQSIGMAKLLLESGADPSLTDQAGFPCWHFIGNPNVRTFVAEYAADI